MKISSPPRKYYLVRTLGSPHLVLCADGEFHHERGVGRGRGAGDGQELRARLYRRRKSARLALGGRAVDVVEVDERGVPWARRGEGRLDAPSASPGIGDPA
jgi:hypothetical protein